MSDPKQVFPPKKVATKVKHRILQNCLKAWGGIIVTSNRGRSVHLAFVDTCCGSGLYAPSDQNSTAEFDYGSAVIGLDSLAGVLGYATSVGATATAKALLINESASELETLKSAIAAHGATIPFDTCPDQLQNVVAGVKKFCANHFAFLLIDPYGPSAIPFSVVSQLVQLKYADTLINFPYYSIHKWAGWLDSGEQEGRLETVDALLNGPAWRDIARRHSGDGKALEAAILEHYMRQLSNLGLGVFALRMAFEDRNRTMYHLIFTSRNTAGLAAAKKELQQGEAYQVALKAELKASKTHQTTFEFMTSESEVQDPVDVNALAANIRATFQEMSPTFDEVVRYGLLKADVLESHVSRALTILKKAKAVNVIGPRYKDQIKFGT